MDDERRGGCGSNSIMNVPIVDYSVSGTITFAARKFILNDAEIDFYS